MTAFEVNPAMPGYCRPQWSAGRWVGSLDLSLLANHDALDLRDSAGYVRARLLVRDGSAVRGFIDVGVLNGRANCAEVLEEVAALPPVESQAATDELPLITVIVCTRDRPDHLRTALTAILQLDYPGFDVVVVDNAPSTSATSDLIGEEFDDARITLLVEPVPGLSKARNTGLLTAVGDIVAFTDDDVVVDSAWLRELAAGFSRAENVDCVSGLVPSGELRTAVQGYFDDRVSWSKNLVPRTYSLQIPSPDLPMFPFCIGEFGTGANFALRRTGALQLGGFDTALGVGTLTGGGEDIDMFTRILLDGRTLVMQPSAIVWHRHRDDLVALRLQARGYGTGLGAWLTKLFLNPRTARMALVRSPHAIARLVSLAWPRRGDAPATTMEYRDVLEREIARVGWLELASVARGPMRYVRERLRGAGGIEPVASELALGRTRTAA